MAIVITMKDGLVVDAWCMPGKSYDGHTLHEALKQAGFLSKVTRHSVC
jgi:hypothetical protein